MEMNDNKFFPLFTDLTKKQIVVFGAGKIAARRVRTLLTFAGKIVCVAPECTEEIESLAQSGEIIYYKKCYERSDLEGADVVLAATNDSAVNERIYEACKAAGILVNVSSDRSKCDFHFPGITEYEGVVIGFNGGGKDHKKVREVRRKTEKLLKGMEKE